MVGAQADESVGEAGRSMLESPGLTSGSDTTQQESKSGRTGSGPGRGGQEGSEEVTKEPFNETDPLK